MTTPRLNSTVLERLAPNLQPQYDRAQTKAGMVHLGIGAFHRAHQAHYTEAVMNQTGGDWRIIGCSLRSASVKQQLESQECLYTLMEKGVETQYQVIGAVNSVLVGPESPKAIIEAIAEPAIKILTLTITEKGYCHDPASGTLNFDHPDIAHDLANPDSPKTAVGYIVAGLRTRRQRELPGLTVLSCDNLPDNGKVTAKVVTQFAQKVSAVLAEWIDQNVTFPSSMIDRIVPATTADDRAALTSVVGYRDEAMVVAEPFSQWVIEDRFIRGRPAWELAGALLVEDVAVYEHMKLRLLNGSHSLLAYTGYLAGYETIDRVMADQYYMRLCELFMRQAALTLQAPAGFDITRYQSELRERFANPGLKHRTWQIAMDGSQKVPQRWLATLRDLNQSGQDIRVFALALAAWMRYTTGEDDRVGTIEVSDPFAQPFKDLWQTHKANADAYVRAFFEQEKIFGRDFSKQPDLVRMTVEFFNGLLAKGAAEVVKTFVET